MKKLDGSKEKVSPVQSDEMANSTEKMIHEELDSLSFQNCSVHDFLDGPVRGPVRFSPVSLGFAKSDSKTDR